jgi:preprotein translocase subunit Sss1
MNFLSDAFAAIYESSLFGVWDEQYRPIFDKLYNEGGYTTLGLMFLLIPAAMMALFYFVWRYPYARLWHWLVWLGVITLVVVASTTGYANSFLAEFLTNPETEEFTSGVVSRYAGINAVLGIITGFIISLGFKMISKIQKHLPF